MKTAYKRLSLVLVLYCGLSLVHNLWLPLHEAPDEVAHFLYSRFIARHGRLPLNQAERDEAGYLSFWPPLYHLGVAALTGWSGSDGPPRLKFVWESPRFELARELLDTKRLANTEDELWPYQGDVLMWRLGRLVSMALGVGIIGVTFFTALEIWPKNYRLATLAAAIIAFVPTFIFISSALSYEALVGLLTGLYFWVLIKIFKGDIRWRNYAWLGLWLGLSVTAKYSTVILPLQVAGVAAYQAWRYRWGWVGWLKRVTLTGFTASLASGWWFLFLLLNFNEVEQLGLVAGLLKPIIAGGIDASQNYTAYLLTGGQIGASDSLEFVPEPGWAWAWRIYRTFWGTEIGGAYPLGVIGPLGVGLLVLAATLGLTQRWRRQPDKRAWLVLLVSHICLFTVFPLLRFLIQGKVDWTAQGRHVLFPVATALPLIIIWGWQVQPWLKLRRWLALALVGGLMAWSLAQWVQMTTAYLPLLPIRTTPEVLAHIPHPLNKSFGPHLLLRGYEAQVLPASGALKVSLYWQAPTYPDEDYLLTLRLLRQDLPLLEWTAYPLNGRYPTRVWENWETIRDDLWLPLLDLPPGDYQVQLQLRGAQGPLPVEGADVLILTDVTLPPMPLLQLDQSLSVQVDGREVVTGFEIWRAEDYRKLDLPEYRPRMTIPILWQGQPGPGQRVQWLLVAGSGQVYSAQQISAHIDAFRVGPEWLPGLYRLRAEVWQNNSVIASQETTPVLTIHNEKPRLMTPPAMTYRLESNFDNRLKLLGYELPQRSLPVGQGLPVTLYWQGLRTMAQSYTVFTKLLDEQHRVWGSAERLPADGYNTYNWLEQEVVVDGFELPVNPSTPPGLYWLNLGLYEEVDRTAVSLPLVLNGQPGETTSVTIGPVKIGGPPPGVVLSPAQVVPQTQVSVQLGQPPLILLRGYDLNPLDSALELTLYWESLAPTSLDWTTFVHLRNEAGQTLAQQDGPTGGGRYPTSLWAKAEIIADKIVVPLPPQLSATNCHLVVGLYNLADGARLAVPNTANGEIRLTSLDMLAVDY